MHLKTLIPLLLLSIICVKTESPENDEKLTKDNRIDNLKEVVDIQAQVHQKEEHLNCKGKNKIELRKKHVFWNESKESRHRRRHKVQHKENTTKDAEVAVTEENNEKEITEQQDHIKEEDEIEDNEDHGLKEDEVNETPKEEGTTELRKESQNYHKKESDHEIKEKRSFERHQSAENEGIPADRQTSEHMDTDTDAGDNDHEVESLKTLIVGEKTVKNKKNENTLLEVVIPETNQKILPIENNIETTNKTTHHSQSTILSRLVNFLTKLMILILCFSAIALFIYQYRNKENSNFDKLDIINDEECVDGDVGQEKHLVEMYESEYALFSTEDLSVRDF
jgi:hypothetical protein